jgi:hypothetical protein
VREDKEGGKLRSSQKTLNDRQVNALRLALTPIEKEMEESHDDNS